MRKSKKLIALLLSMSMCATCFTACGGNGDDPASSSSNAADNSHGGDVKVNMNDVDEFAKGIGVEVPESVDNNSDAEKVSLKVWGPTEEQTIITELCKKFDEAHPEYDMDVEVGIVSEDQGASTVSQDVSNAADVFYFSGDQLSQLVEAGYVSKIADSIATEVQNDQIEGAYNSVKRDDGIYAIPFTANLWYMFYNKSIYKDPSVVESLDKMMEQDLGKDVYNFSIDIANGWYIASFFYAGGCTLFGADGSDPTQCDWAEDKGIAVVDYISKLVQTGKLYKDESSDSIAKLKDGTVAAFCTGSWNANVIKESLGDNYAATVAPKINVNGTEANLMPFADYKMIGVNATSKNQKPAQLLAQFLGGDYAQIVRVKEREIQPTVKALVDNDKLDFATEYPAVAASLEQMSYTVNRPSTSQIQNFWNPAKALGAYIYKQKSEVTDDNRASYIKENIISKIVSK